MLSINIRNKITKIIFSILILSLLTACFGGGSSTPDDHFYRLPELTATKLEQPVLNGSLRVRKVITHGIYSERTLIYTDKLNRIKLNRYHYHHWEKSPSSVIQDNLVQYLKNTGVAKKIIYRKEFTRANYILEAELISMHRDTTSNDYIASITIDFRLYNNSNNSTFINKRYSSDIKADSDKLVDTIKAYGDGLQKIYEQLISDMQR